MNEPRRAAILVFGLSFGLMLLELCQTRVLSAIFYHHTAFLALSLAMLGLGGGAILPALNRLPPALSAALAALATLVLPAVFPLVQVDQDLLVDLGNTVLIRALALASLAALLPFLFGGAALAALFREARDRLPRLYAVDLVGAALATLVMVPTMAGLGGPASLPATGAAIAGASALAARQGRVTTIVLTLALATISGLATGGRLFRLEVRLAAEDQLPGGRQPRLLFEKWNAFSRISVLENAGWDRGLSARTMRGPGGKLPEQREALIDVNAFAPIVRFDGDLEPLAPLRREVSNIGMQLLPGGPRIAVIGPGGGKDLLGALLFAPSRLVGIELNEILVDDLVRGRFRDFGGDLYGREDLEIVIGDGRSELRRIDGAFDLILANSVATWAAQASGAMNLTENHVFTLEAFGEYRDRLAPRGMLSISLWDEVEHGVPMRIAATWIAAARAAGVEDAAREVALIGNYWDEGRWFSTILMRKGGYADPEIALLADRARDFGFDLLHLPGREGLAPDFGRFLADPEGFDRASAYDLSPASDDRPFVFYTGQVGRSLTGDGGERRSDNGALRSLIWSLVLVGGLVTLLLLLPLILRRSRPERRTTARETLHFAALGYGYLAVEIVLIQRLSLFLGHPTRSLTVALFALLLGSGLGSRLSGRAVGPRALLVLLMLVLALILFLGIDLVETRLIGLPLLARLALAVALVVPAGFLMGMPMPIALTRLGRDRAGALPWAFGINCATGVLASVATILAAIELGFRQTSLLALAAYALALVSAPGGDGSRRRTQNEATAATTTIGSQDR